MGTARASGARVVDLSSDFRPGTGEGEAPYGLTELMRAKIPGADIVAHPGCYPTAAILPLAPLVKDQMVSSDGIVIDAFVLLKGLINFIKDFFANRNCALPHLVCLVNLLAIVGAVCELYAVLFCFSRQTLSEIVDLSFDLLDLNLGIADLCLQELL